MPDNPCDAWNELIFGQNRGQIYDYFNRHQQELIRHLDSCESCLVFVLQIDPVPDVIDHLEFMDAPEFADLIRRMYANAQGILIK